jgi:tripartite-type tricarboxylate transporter receptor subunit TctC
MMNLKLPRRKFLHLAASAIALPAVSGSAWAQAYPLRPVHIIVGFPAGSGADVVGRLIGQLLSERLGQQFIIENRPGAGTNIATETVVRAPADGYSLLLVTAANAVNTTLYDNLNFNFVRDIAPVALIGGGPFVMVVNPSVPAKTLADFIVYAKANPGKINMASFGNGTMAHLCGELFKMMTGLDLVHVPYRSSYMPDLLGGQVQVLFDGIAGLSAYIRTGKLRALAVTTATRQEVLPDIPTVGESVPGYEASGYLAIGAPTSTPAPIVEMLNREIDAVVADPNVKARFVDLGLEPKAMTPVEFGKFIADQTDKWAKVIRFANIRPD